jgi:hypothetical protein
MVPFLLPWAPTGLTSIAAWGGSGTTAMVICLHTAARTLRAERSVQGDVLSVWQVLHGTPSVPRISAQRVAQFGIVSKPAQKFVGRLTLFQDVSQILSHHKTT